MTSLDNYKSYESQYMEIANTIMTKGYLQMNQRTGVGTYRIPHAVMTVDLEKEFPILKSKFVTWKSALQEILWIMQKQSNDINKLGNHIWDAWADETGSIGAAYGYQVAKPVTENGITYDNQVDYVLRRLANDSSDRRAVINLWDVDDIQDMALTPCCYSSVWNIIDGKLNCMLVQRSADFLVGVPFNTTQYAILTHLFARHLGIGVGKLTHVMADCHIYNYESHVTGFHKMKNNYEKICYLNYLRDVVERDPNPSITPQDNEELEKCKHITYSNPKLVINTTETNFFSISVDDIRVEDYSYMEKIKFDVAT